MSLLSSRMTTESAILCESPTTIRSMKIGDIRTVVEFERAWFPKYDHVFSFESLEKWFRHNHDMFLVITDRDDSPLGYAAIIPVDRKLLAKLRHGKVSSVVEFAEGNVPGKSPFVHLEVLAVRPDLRGTIVGRQLLRAVADRLLTAAKIVTTSPVNQTGMKLCRYFGFKRVSAEHIGRHLYSIYELRVDRAALKSKIALLPAIC